MVGKIGTAKRTPAKPAVKRVAKPGAKPAVKRVANAVKPGVKRVANAVKRVAKPGAKPGVKRAGVKRATPKAKKVNFNKLLIIIRNVANRTHKKGRMTGGALEDAKNTIFKYLVGSELTSAIIGLFKNADDANLLLNLADADGIKKIGTFDVILTNMDKVQSALISNADTKNIGFGICKKNEKNFKEIDDLDTDDNVLKAKTAVPLATPLAIEKNAHLTSTNTDFDSYVKSISTSNEESLDENIKKYNKSLHDEVGIKTEYEKLIKILIDINYDPTYKEVNKASVENKKNFAMLMIAITLAKIHKIIEAM